MTQCEFEEKQYEHAANAEFSWSRIQSWASGQVGEGTLGFDVAVSVMPKSYWLWNRLGLLPQPGGIPDPLWWPSRRASIHQVNGRLISLFLQYKRPDYLFHRNAKQRHLWNRDYYRFVITKHQHGILQHLEKQARGTAGVQYASPVFHTTEELHHLMDSQEVLRQSHFVSPEVIDQTHCCYTYTLPDAKGKPNPSGEEVPSGGLDYLFSSMQELAKEISLYQHASQLAGSIESVLEINIERDISRLEELLDQSPYPYPEETRYLLRSMAMISLAAGQIGIDWLVLRYE